MSGLNGMIGFLYQFGDAAAFLILCASGLAIIFGMMGVINLAHGEFIMAGAYATVTAEKLGAPLPLAIACGALFSGIGGPPLCALRCFGRAQVTVLTRPHGGEALLYSTATRIGAP